MARVTLRVVNCAEIVAQLSEASELAREAAAVAGEHRPGLADAMTELRNALAEPPVYEVEWGKVQVLQAKFRGQLTAHQVISARIAAAMTAVREAIGAAKEA